jgi:hypothetical protein
MKVRRRIVAALFRVILPFLVFFFSITYALQWIE